MFIARPLQSVDVRRGRLIANAESFVHMLGTAIETLLTQVVLCGAFLPATSASGRADDHTGRDSGTCANHDWL